MAKKAFGSQHERVGRPCMTPRPARFYNWRIRQVQAIPEVWFVDGDLPPLIGTASRERISGLSYRTTSDVHALVTSAEHLGSPHGTATLLAVGRIHGVSGSMPATAS
jgi:hypothetical protein